METIDTLFHPPADEAIGGAWRLDPARSSVEFRVPKFWGLVTITGHFDAYRGRLDLSADPAIELTIDAASLETGNRKRDEHLRSADFFDAEEHPQVRFASESVVVQDETLKVRGRLSARDRSVPLELDAQLRWADGELEIEATATVPHRELGMTWSPARIIAERSEVLVKGRLLPG
jgi:polyisoprenoid-binding protein YceI